MTLVFTVNRTTAPTRRETIGGTDYLIVPVVALVAGVVNGELVAPDQIRPAEWNGVPVPLGHPQVNGEYVSDRTPELETASPGRFYNARLEGNALKGEIWINLAQAKQGEAAEAVKRFEAGQMVNVSTAYFRDLAETQGEYNGKAYAGIATNLKPDHLAILLNEDGACSLRDGCGAPRVNQLKVNQLDFSDGVMIAFYPSATDAQALTITGDGLPEGSEIMPASQLHVTLCMLGKIDEITQSEGTALKELADFASRMPIVRATVGGAGQFNNNDDLNAIFAIIDSTYLQDWRRSLVYWIEDYFNIRRDFGFMPHMTLAYTPAGQPVTLPILERREIIFDSVALSWGSRTTVFRLQGEAREMTEEMSANKRRPAAWEFLTRLASKIGFRIKSQETEDTTVKRDELIATLATNSGGKLSQETLGKFTDCELQALSDQLGEAPAAQPDPAPKPETPAPAPQADPMVERLTKIEQALAGLTGQIQANVNQEKADLMARLAVNQQTFTEAELSGFELPLLRKLAGALTPADYGLRGLPVVNTAGEWEEYKAPAISQNGGAK